MKRRIDAHVVMEKLVPRITEEYRKIYDIPENHQSMAIISGEKVADVKSGLQYAKDYIENKSGNYSLNEEGTLGYYVDYVPRIGKYYQESLGLSEGTSIAYLVSAPVESMYGLDKALKAADVKIAELSEIPSRVNTGGAIVYGTESACRSAVEAFAEGVEYCAFHPMDIE